MDFVDKKERLADLIEEYIEDREKEQELMQLMDELREDEDFKRKELFQNIFDELSKYLPDLSRRELKQRVLMIRTYLD